MWVGGQPDDGAALPPGITRKPGGPQGRTGLVRKNSPSPEFDPLPVQPVANCYTDWAIAVHAAECSTAVKLTNLYDLQASFRLSCKANGRQTPEVHDLNSRTVLAEVRISAQGTESGICVGQTGTGTRQTTVLGEEHVPRLLRPPQIPYWVPWNRTWASAMKVWRPAP